MRRLRRRRAPGHRPTPRTPLFTLALAAALAAPLAACDPGTPGGTDAGFEADGEPIDHPMGGAVAVDEQALRAGIIPDMIMVNLALRPLDGAAAGLARATLYRLGEPEPLAEGEVEFAVDGPDVVPIPVEFAVEYDALAELADYVIEYRVDGAGEDARGRRGLLTAVAPAEVQVLGPDRFPAGGDGILRVIAREPDTGRPLTETAVRVAFTPESAEEAVELGAGRTDALGQITLAVPTPVELLGAGTLTVAVDDPAAPQAVRASVQVERASKVMLTTDKPLYQPGQTMHLRALALNRADRRPVADAPLVFEVFDGKDNKVDRIQATTDGFGVAAATFTLAREVNMGAYRIAALLDGVATEKTVTVSRYTLPKFDLDLALDQPVYLAGEPLVGTLTARYFFGAAVDGGEVRVQAATLDAGRTVFAETMGRTNGDGLYRFDVRLPDYVVGLPLEQGGGLIELAIEVVDTAGQARSVTRTVRVARAPLEVTVVPESGQIVPGLVNTLRVRSTDAAGQPVAAEHTLTVDGERIAFATGADGLGAVDVLVDGSALAVTIESVDGAGNAISQDLRFAAGDASDGALRVRTAQALYRVGDTLTVEIDVVGASAPVYVDAVREGQTVLTERLMPDAEGRAALDIELAPEHVGTLQIDAYYLAQSSSIRRDAAIVYVEDAGGLAIAVESDREVYKPAEDARLRFTVTDAEGNGAATALGIQIVDEAVFSLMEFRPGLEKVYFLIEEALAQPRSQIGVPALSTLTGRAGAADDPTTQGEAAMLFAATDGIDIHPLSVNTLRARNAAVPGVVRGFVQAWAEAYFEELGQDVQRGDLDRAGLDARVAADAGRRADPWGQRWIMEVADDRLRIATRGPDERLDTADDVEVSFGLACGVFEPCPQAADDWDEADPGVPEGPDRAGGEGEGEGEGEGGGPRIRRNFPETLLVEPSLITDASGRAELTVPLADSITTWRVTALGNTADGRLGSTQSGIRVFQDFFVDLDVPATLTRGDEFTVPVALYNYLDVPQQVRIEAPAAEWVELLGPAEQVIDLGPGEVRGVELPIRVTQVGLHELLVFAYGDQLEDAVARSILVEPDGQKVESAQSGRLEGVIEQAIRLPGDMVEGSGRLLVKLYPGLFASVVEGLDSILRMPSGCFEQTSSSTWPNGLVMLYMRETDAGTPEVALQAEQYVNTGYQRLLTFEVPGGGFEWFGQSPAHEVLTAYGLLEFVDLARVRPIDARMIERTRAWLLGRQGADGAWTLSSRGLDETGNLTDPVTITAYIAFALAAAGEDGPEMQRAAQYLAGNAGAMGTYTTALYANFLVQLAPGDAATGQTLARLAGMVEADIADDPTRHWRTDEQTTTYGAGEPAWIETTALATHALLAADAHPEVTGPALDWIISKKQASGGWGSTAGTVWSIKCLLQALRASQDPGADATIRVRLDGIERAAFDVTPATSDVMRQADLSDWLTPGVEQTVEIELEGAGNLMYSVAQRHHMPWAEAPPAEGPLSIAVEYDRTQLAVDDTVEVQVTVRNDDITFADMVMVDLGVPPGFEVMRDDLDALVAEGVISKHEVTERQVLLYFTAILPERPVSFTYRIVARHPIRAEAPASRIYSYYNPDVGRGTEPVLIEVR